MKQHSCCNLQRVFFALLFNKTKLKHHHLKLQRLEGAAIGPMNLLFRLGFKVSNCPCSVSKADSSNCRLQATRVSDGQKKKCSSAIKRNLLLITSFLSQTISIMDDNRQTSYCTEDCTQKNKSGDSGFVSETFCK